MAADTRVGLLAGSVSGSWTSTTALAITSASERGLANWVGAARRGELAVLGSRQKPLTDSEQKLARLRRELAEVTMERDILLPTLPEHRCPGTC